MRILQLLCILLLLCVALLGRAEEEPGLDFALNDKGLARLTYRGHAFLVHPSDGGLAPFARTPVFADAMASVLQEQRLEGDSLILSYNWGTIRADYSAVGRDQMDIAITVSNSSKVTLNRLMLGVGRLNYPQIPTVHSVGVSGAFTGGVFGAANAVQRPPVVLLTYGDAALLVAGDRYLEDYTTGVFFAEAGGLINRVGVGFTDIAPETSKSTVFTLRFGPADSTLRSLGGDFLDAYAKVNPSTLDWPDRRPIGKIFLASQGNGEDQPRRNPNRWFMNARDVDVETDAGKEAFRQRLLAFADGAVKALKYQGAQGGITWDPEGQRTGHTYYGDPRIIQWIAPEMEYRGEHETATIDAYFAKYTVAGLRHGICVRPQRVRPEGDYWVQEEMPTAEGRLAELRAKIGYAHRRWGSTLVYIDSDYAVTAREYRVLHEEFPAVLLIPEWEQPLHFAYTAPLQSFFHHRNIGTPADVRALYPQAFSVNMMDNIGEVTPELRARVAAAVRAGDIPMVNAWYIHAGLDVVKALYAEPPPAGVQPTTP